MSIPREKYINNNSLYSQSYFHCNMMVYNIAITIFQSLKHSPNIEFQTIWNRFWWNHNDAS